MKKICRDGEMGQWLRTSFALAADQSSVPSNHSRHLRITVAQVSGDFMPSFNLCGHLHAHIYPLSFSIK